jgi:hypothetical protein
MIIHERYARDEPVVRGSDRKFGITMAAAFAVMSLLNWWHHGHSWHWMGTVAVLFIAAALFYPVALKPFSWIWTNFGLLLQKVTNPIIIAVVFFGALLPTSLILRALGKDPLRLKQPDATSYWIERHPPGAAAQSMKHQF